MSDLEEVLSELHRQKESLKNQIKFIKKLEKLFSNFSTSLEMGAESISWERLTNWIDKVIIYGD